MSGSHAAALKFCLERVAPKSKVLDVGAGMSPLAGWLASEKGCDVLAFDVNHERLTRGWTNANRVYRIQHADAREIKLQEGFYDYAVALYSLQCMIGYEPLVWCRIRSWLKTGGSLLAASRYYLDSPRYEGDRGDPLLSQDERTISMLAKFCGFAVEAMQAIWYDEKTFQEEPLGSSRANAILFQLKAV
jgi:uncharacterized UPF0146 family protein